MKSLVENNTKDSDDSDDDVIIGGSRLNLRNDTKKPSPRDEGEMIWHPVKGSSIHFRLSWCRKKSFNFAYHRLFLVNRPADLTVRKRPGTSYRIEIHFAVFNLLYLLFSFAKLVETW